MGAEAMCALRVGRRRIEGRAQLETDALIFRGGDVRVSIPYNSISSVETSGGALHVKSKSGLTIFELGSTAGKWAEKIRNPPTRIDKLGVKNGQRVLLIEVHDADLRSELGSCGASVATRPSGEADAIFLEANDRRALTRLTTLMKHLKRDGAVWVIRPKGNGAISEGNVLTAGRNAGLVDVKVVRFSDTHSAHKFVIPRGRR